MRPRKRVLLFCVDERELSVAAFLLHTKHYAVTRCRSIEDVAAAVASIRFDAGLILHTVHPDANRVGASLGNSSRDVPLLGVVLSRWNMAKIKYPAARLLFAPTNAELLETLRILVIHKRGPRKVEGIAEQVAV